MSARVLALIGKGGSGKTTAAGTLAAVLTADTDLAVRLVDLDSAATLTTWLAPGMGDDDPAVDDVLTGDADLAKVTRPVRERLEVVVGSSGLVRIEGERTIGAAVRQLVADAREDADLVLLDCRGGTASLLARAALQAADGAIMPVEASPMSEQPVIDAAEVLDGLATPLLGLLPNRGRGTVVGRKYLANLEADGWPILPHIRQDVRATEAVAAHQLLDDYAPGCKALADYRAAAAALDLARG